jgi:hypothetical protein
MRTRVDERPTPSRATLRESSRERADDGLKPAERRRGNQGADRGLGKLCREDDANEQRRPRQRQGGVAEGEEAKSEQEQDRTVTIAKHRDVRPLPSWIPTSNAARSMRWCLDDMN